MGLNFLAILRHNNCHISLVARDYRTAIALFIHTEKGFEGIQTVFTASLTPTIEYSPYDWDFAHLSPCANRVRLQRSLDRDGREPEEIRKQRDTSASVNDILKGWRVGGTRKSMVDIEQGGRNWRRILVAVSLILSYLFGPMTGTCRQILCCAARCATLLLTSTGPRLWVRTEENTKPLECF